MLSGFLADPTTVLVGFFLCCAIAVASLLKSLKHGGSSFGIFVALVFAGIAAFLVPQVADILYEINE